MQACLSGGKPPLIDPLSHRFTLVACDRRGRGESGDTPPFAVGCQIEEPRILPGQTHGVQPAALTPNLVGFLGA